MNKINTNLYTLSIFIIFHPTTTALEIAAVRVCWGSAE